MHVGGNLLVKRCIFVFRKTSSIDNLLCLFVLFCSFGNLIIFGFSFIWKYAHFKMIVLSLKFEFKVRGIAIKQQNLFSLSFFFCANKYSRYFKSVKCIINIISSGFSFYIESIRKRVAIAPIINFPLIAQRFTVTWTGKLMFKWVFVRWRNS